MSSVTKEEWIITNDKCNKGLNIEIFKGLAYRYLQRHAQSIRVDALVQILDLRMVFKEGGVTHCL